MKRVAVMAAMLLAPVVWADTEWFTVAGDPLNPSVDTVQVNPESVDRQGELRVLNIRVNRAQLRQNWDGIGYRSYTAQVHIHCDARKGDYLQIQLFDQPLWQGDTQSRRYAQPRPPMLFKDMAPNPTERIVRAACARPEPREP